MVTRFTKMHGLGNDFVVFDAIHQSLSLTPELVRHIAERRFGIGCDQVLLVEAATQPEVDFRYRIYNADGGEVEQCGNGARCFARFVRDKGLTDKNEIAVETRSGVIRLSVQPDNEVTVNMGVPQFEPKDVPFDAPARETNYLLDLDGEKVKIGVVSMGNPHAVQVVSDVDTARVAEQGPRFQRHARFPKRVNAGFMQVLDRDHIRLRVYERGVGETLACGTGACAAMAVGRQMGLLDDRVSVELPGGRLNIAWEGEGQPVYMTGPAVSVFEGEIDLDGV
ncbi:MAG: diaminopimelate epimerase [Acidiferrobacterales bacterium]|jgi:diaminopimelate epimerase|nr:diaminopimelate epimerase [Acidiferrobacterales bacterium]